MGTAGRVQRWEVWTDLCGERCEQVRSGRLGREIKVSVKRWIG